jgi:hypothetical protein
MITNRKPALIFEGEFDEREEMECRDRGYRSHVSVELANGERYPVVFYDSVRIQQDLEDEVKSGSPFIAEPGLIVLPEVTRENMERAVTALAVEGFFEALRPMSQNADAAARTR